MIPAICSNQPTFQMNTTTTDNQAEQTEKRIRIAKACGWKLHAAKYLVDKTPIWHCASGWQHPPSHDEWGNRHAAETVLPDYFNDLNAMAEAEKTLSAHGWILYQVALHKTSPPDPNYSVKHYIHATASQRAEAFLLTIAP